MESATDRRACQDLSRPVLLARSGGLVRDPAREAGRSALGPEQPRMRSHKLGSAKAPPRGSGSERTVVIGPFIEWKLGSSSGGTTNGPRFVSAVPSGLPRSHARLSKSPKTWQLAQAESPWLELSEALYRKRRPWTMLGGSGLCIGTCATSACVWVSMTDPLGYPASGWSLPVVLLLGCAHEQRRPRDTERRG